MNTESHETTVLVAFGSNIDPEDSIRRAVRLLDERVGVLAVSNIYRSPALDRPGHPDFLNGACSVTPACPPHELKFSVLRAIEDELGRVRSEDAYAPRTIDLDIALYGDCVIDEPDLRIPDPGIAGRPFLTVPLAELAPDHVVPGTGRSLGDLAGALDADDLELDADCSRQLKADFKERHAP